MRQVIISKSLGRRATRRPILKRTLGLDPSIPKVPAAAFLAAIWLGVATVAGILLMGLPHTQVGYALPISAGVTLYVAATDLIPEVNREPDTRMALLVFLGVSIMLLLAHIFRA